MKPLTTKNKTLEKSVIEEMPKNLTTYLGQKGYTILKSELTIKQQTFIKEQLTVKPYVPGSPVQLQKSFPAYRESDKKLYIPRYYGDEIFGPAAEYKLTEGLNIDLKFAGTLRDYQIPVTQKYLDHVSSGGGGLLELYCAWGKCLKYDTPIIMFDGLIKKVQDIIVGDILMGDDSTPRNVLSLAKGKEQMYKITNIRGDTYTVNESHILSLKTSSNYGYKYIKGEIVDISIKDYLNLPKSFHGKGGALLGYKVGVEFKETIVEFDPYLFGFWLGDGTSSSPSITTQDSVILKYIIDLFKNKYTDLYLRYHSKYDYRVCGIGTKPNRNRFLNFLKNKNLLNNKHIPYDYKCNDRQTRLKLLAGLIDSDGYNKGNCYEIVQKNSILADDIVYLCRSLGFACYSKKCKKTCTNSKNGPKKGEYNRISIYGSGLEHIPVLCRRKKCSERNQIKDALVSRIHIEKLEVDDYYGFSIDGNRRFLLGDFTVTHNTSSSLYILSKLEKKTIVIVHKEFLMNQWIERIQQFLPGARIGKIQGQIIDIDNKDIVLCMLQSLVLKEYPSSLFDSFGLTIIDEVHHISSETFSNALFKVVTKYMLGLSATMNRKDGTTKVFKMFLGPVVHKAEKKADNTVQIRAVTYKTNDDDFNETILDFKGQPQISSMISKLCSYNRRTEFIVKLLTDFIEVDNIDKDIIEKYKQDMDNANPSCEICKKNNHYLLKNTCCSVVKYCMPCLQKIEENAEQNITYFIGPDGNQKSSKERPKCPTCKKVLKYEQNYIENPYIKPLNQLHTIVLSHNLNVLHYIYKKFVCKNLASVGYYVGGMSEKELKNSETKQIILASYSMANEGLDIPTLNAEFLLTPKTDIVQTIGRVLRAKHAFSDPIIYDIVDNHDVFQRQWLKRKAYYKKNNYNIIGCDIHNYNKDTAKWKSISGHSATASNKNDDDNSDDDDCEEKEKNIGSGKCLLTLKK